MQGSYKNHVIEFQISLAFFLIVISYMQPKYGTTQLKNVGFIILDILVLYECLKHSKGTLKRSEILSFLIIFCGLTFISILSRMDFHNFVVSVMYNLNLLIFTVFSKYLFRNKLKRLDCIFWGIFSGVIFIVINSMNYIKPQLHNQIYNGGRIRIYGAFSHPNISGSIAMSAIMCWFISYRCVKGRKKLSVYELIALIVLAGVLVLSNSRTSITCTLLFIALIIVNNNLEKLHAASIKLLIKISVIISIIFAVLINLDELLNEKTLLIRLNSIYEIKDNINSIWIGNGNRGNAIESYYFGTEMSYTLIILKFGIIGAFIFGYILFGYLKKINKISIKKFRYIAKIILFIFLINCIGEAFLINITNLASVFYWMIITILTDYENINKIYRNSGVYII